MNTHYNVIFLICCHQATDWYTLTLFLTKEYI
jgi:hypothetical protein